MSVPCPFCNIDADRVMHSMCFESYSFVLLLPLGQVARTSKHAIMPAPWHAKSFMDLSTMQIGALIKAASALMAQLGHKHWRLQFNQGRWQDIQHVHLHLRTVGHVFKNCARQSDHLAV